MAHSMSYVHTGIGTSVLYPSVGVCARTVLVPILGVILVRVVGTYILATSRKSKYKAHPITTEFTQT